MIRKINEFDFGLHVDKEYSIKDQKDAIWEDFKDIKIYVNKLHEQIESLILEVEELQLNKKTSKIQKIEIVKFLGEEIVPKPKHTMKDLKWTQS